VPSTLSSAASKCAVRLRSSFALNAPELQGGHKQGHLPVRDAAEAPCLCGAIPPGAIRTRPHPAHACAVRAYDHGAILLLLALRRRQFDGCDRIVVGGF